MTTSTSTSTSTSTATLTATADNHRFCIDYWNAAALLVRVGESWARVFLHAGSSIFDLCLLKHFFPDNHKDDDDDASQCYNLDSRWHEIFE